MKKIILATLVALSFMPSLMKAADLETVSENETSADSSIFLTREGNTNVLTVFKKKYQLTFVNKIDATKNNYYNNLPRFYIGFTQLSPTGTIGKSDALSQKGTSYEWGMYLMAHDFTFNRQGTLGATVGLGFSRTSFRFRDNNALMKDANNNLVFDKFTDNSNIDKSWFRYWSFRMPICFGWAPKGSGFSISAGPELEWRLGTLSRVKYNDKKHTIVNDPDIDNLAVNLLVNIGFDGLNVIGRLGLTDLMKINSSNVKAGNDFHVAPVMIGIGLDL